MQDLLAKKRSPAPLPLPAPVGRAIQQLGRDISLARRRRYMDQASLAARIGCSIATIRRLEKGDPRIPIHFVARALYVFGEIERLSGLLGSGDDEIGLMLMDERVPRRVRARKSNDRSGAF